MKQAAFWIVSEKRYADEAAESANTFAVFHPGIDCILFTCEKYADPVFNKIAILPPLIGEYWYLDSVRYYGIAFDMLEEYDQLLALDSDVYFIGSCPELFEVLDRFDIVAPMGSRRVTGATHVPIPFTFAEYEIGVMAFRRNDVVRKLFAEWERLHWAYPDVYGMNDMRSFREAVWNTPEIHIDRLPTEYALRWPFGVFMSLTVKVLHGRPLGLSYPDSPTIDEVASIVNEHKDMRIWSPRTPDWPKGVIPTEREYD